MLAHYRLPFTDTDIGNTYPFPILIYGNCFRGVEVIDTITSLQYNALLLMLNFALSFHTHSFFSTHSISYEIIMPI